MESTDIKQVSVTSKIVYLTENDNIGYMIIKEVTDNIVQSIVVSASRINSNDNLPLGVWQFTSGRKLYSPNDECTDEEELIITKDFKIILLCVLN